MNKNVGASFTLSVLVVGFFAVVLYQPDPKTIPRPARTDPPVAPTNDLVVSGPRPELIRPVAPPPPILPVKASPKSSTRPVASPPKPKADPPAKKPAIARKSEKRGAFTTILEGETLEDVATRVYGTGSNSQLLWNANRDLLESKDGPPARRNGVENALIRFSSVGATLPDDLPGHALTISRTPRLVSTMVPDEGLGIFAEPAPSRHQKTRLPQ